MKTIKRKKATRQIGRRMGTHGSGARKNKRKSGNKGGTGMAGTGKRADHKKTLVQKLYGHKYFGKQGITSRGTVRDIRQRINLRDIELNLGKYGKLVGEVWELNLKNYKILGTGEVKHKLKITCLQASKTAIEKVTKTGGEIVIKVVKKIETPFVEFKKDKAKK